MATTAEDIQVLMCNVDHAKASAKPGAVRLKDYFEEHAAEKQLLRHDKALHRKAPPVHLKHVPAYLKDASTVADRGVSKTGHRGKGFLPGAKRRNIERSKDPLKAGGFIKAPKKGLGEEEHTEAELKAMAIGKREAKRKAKEDHTAFVPKAN
eukprot:gene18232-24684_t